MLNSGFDDSCEEFRCYRSRLFSHECTEDVKRILRYSAEYQWYEMVARETEWEVSVAQLFLCVHMNHAVGETLYKRAQRY